MNSDLTLYYVNGVQVKLPIIIIIITMVNSFLLSTLQTIVYFLCACVCVKGLKCALYAVPVCACLSKCV